MKALGVPGAFFILSSECAKIGCSDHPAPEISQFSK